MPLALDAPIVARYNAANERYAPYQTTRLPSYFETRC